MSSHRKAVSVIKTIVGSQGALPTYNNVIDFDISNLMPKDRL